MAIWETINGYYNRGKFIQYNAQKDCFFPREEAIQQNINHLTCSSFNSSVYQELLNVLVPLSFLHGLDYVTKYFDSPM